MLGFLLHYYHGALLLLFAPCLTILTSIAAKKFRKISDLLFFLFSLIPAIFVFTNLHSVDLTILQGNDILPNIGFFFKTSSFGNIFAALIAILYPLTTMYAIGYLNVGHYEKRGKFHSLVSISVFAALCLAYSGNFFTSFIFYDIITIATYFLIAHSNTEQIRKASFRYVLYLTCTSMVFLFPVMCFLYVTTGTTDFTPNGIIGNIPLSDYVVNIALLFCILGIAKTAILPFHSWIIDAMVAPAPVSGLLHAVLVVKSGAFLLYNVVYNIFGLPLLNQAIIKIYNLPWPVYLAIATIIFGSLSALMAHNIKKRLAYSTISQISYICLAIFLFNEFIMEAGIIQFISHSVAKLTLFFYAGILYVKYGVHDIQDIKIRSRTDMLVTVSTIIAILGLIGLPPTFGFISKYTLIKTSLRDPSDLPIFITIIVSTISTVFYLMPFFYSIAQTRSNNRKFRNKKTTTFINNALMETPLGILMILSVCLFMAFSFHLDFDILKSLKLATH